MSGRPNIQEIAELREALSALTKADEDIERALIEAKRAEGVRVGAITRRDGALRKVEELMASMDCAATGNFGYHNRLLSLLGGLSEYAEQYGRVHP